MVRALGHRTGGSDWRSPGWSSAGCCTGFGASLGAGVGLGLAAVLADGVQDHGHVATVLARRGLDHRDVTDVFCDPVQDLQAELRVGHLTTAEHDRELDLVAFAQEPHHVLHLGDVVVLVDLGPELHLLDDDVRGLALRLTTTLFLLVDVAPVVHDPADRGVGVGRHLDQIELELPGVGKRFREWLDAELLALGTDEEDFASSNAVVDPDLVCSYLVTSYRGRLGRERKMTDTGSVRHADVSPALVQHALRSTV